MNYSSHREKLVSGLGGAISIFCVFWLTRFFEQELSASLLLIASMGATAVLLFAAPNAALSQPWNVIGGHTVSGTIGLIIHFLIPDPIIGGALSVGLAITAMHYLNCLHPPGGATSLIPLISGSVIDTYGIFFVLMPVGLGSIAMVLIAIAFNYRLKGRRYPQSLADEPEPVPHYPNITHEDLVAALNEVDSFTDISEQDLLHIYDIATSRSLRRKP